MDLWEKFGMSEGLAEMWQGLGISVGTAIIVETDVRDKSKFFGELHKKS